MMTDELVYFADLKCTACGGSRDLLRRHNGRMEYISHCRKCDKERRASRRYWLRSGKRVETDGCLVSEWDMETEYIYNSVKWEPKVRPKVKTMYRRDEISALPCEKMLRILELARIGQVIII